MTPDERIIEADAAERRLVAAVLEAPELRAHAPGIRPESFRLQDVSRIWQEIVSAEAEGRPVVAADYWEHLSRYGPDAIPLPEFVTEDARRVAEAAACREIVAHASQAVRYAYAAELRAARGAMLDGALVAGLEAPSAVRASDAASELYDDVENPEAAEAALIHLSPLLDDALGGGLPRETLSLVMARPSVGKTSLLCWLASLAAEAGRRVYIASCEESRKKIMHRMLFGRARVSTRAWRKGGLTNDDLLRLRDELTWMRQHPGLIVDDFGGREVGALDISDAVDALAARGERPDVVMVDHIGQLRVEGENRNVGIGEAARALRRIGVRHNCAVVSAVQLSRAAIGDRPDLHHLYESGHLEQVADIVLAIWRESYERQTDDQTAEIIVRKNRDGARDVVAYLVWLGKHRWYGEKAIGV